VAARSTEHILIVEDEPILCEILRATFEYGGYTCETAATGAAALEHFQKGKPDAVIADLGLPDCDGIEFIAALRGLSRVPVIVVSGRSAEADKIAALDHGADDYVEKPFLPGELVARVRAKLRHHHAGQLEGPASPEQIMRESEIGLSRMERALLSFLVQRQGATASEEEIIATLWEPHCKATSADLRSLVLKVRRKLQVQHQPLFVVNDRGVGYYIARGWDRFPHEARDEAQVVIPFSPGRFPRKETG